MEIKINQKVKKEQEIIIKENFNSVREFMFADLPRELQDVYIHFENGYELAMGVRENNKDVLYKRFSIRRNTRGNYSHYEPDNDYGFELNTLFIDKEDAIRILEDAIKSFKEIPIYVRELENE